MGKTPCSSPQQPLVQPPRGCSPTRASAWACNGGGPRSSAVSTRQDLELAVERVRLGYRYKGGGTDLKVIGDYFADDSWKVTGGFSQATDFGGRASITGLHHQRGADESRTRLGVGYTQDGLSASAFWERERSIGSDVSTLGGQLSASRDDWSAYMRAQASTDGSHEAAAGVNHRLSSDASGVWKGCRRAGRVLREWGSGRLPLDF